jgi:hypothetical protein
MLLKILAFKGGVDRGVDRDARDPLFLLFYRFLKFARIPRSTIQQVKKLYLPLVIGWEYVRYVKPSGSRLDRDWIAVYPVPRSTFGKILMFGLHKVWVDRGSRDFCIPLKTL